MSADSDDSLHYRTQLLLADPHRFLSLAGSADLYIALLRQVATHHSTFSGALKRKMKDTPFILGYEQARGVQRSKPKSLMDDDDDEEVVLQYRLGLASEIVIIDDTTTLNDFREFIIAAPQDDIIEGFVEVRNSVSIRTLTNAVCAGTRRQEDKSLGDDAVYLFDSSRNVV